MTRIRSYVRCENHLLPALEKSRAHDVLMVVPSDDLQAFVIQLQFFRRVQVAQALNLPYRRVDRCDLTTTGERIAVQGVPAVRERLEHHKGKAVMTYRAQYDAG